MLEIASQIIICLIIAAIIGFMIGYLVAKLSTKVQSRNNDNLQLIKGIGSTTEKSLNKLGVYSFEQIANSDDKYKHWLEKHHMLIATINKDNWVEQAKILATGASTEFSKRVEKGEVSTSNKS